MNDQSNRAHDEPDPTRCPLCGGPNSCALMEGRPIEACWCVATKVPEEVLSRIPPERRRQSCVCRHCATSR